MTDKEREAAWHDYTSDPKTSCVVDLCSSCVPYGSFVMTTSGPRPTEALWALTWAREYLIYGEVNALKDKENKVYFMGSDEHHPRARKVKRASGSLATLVCGGQRGDDLAKAMHDAIVDCRLALAGWMQDEGFFGPGEYLSWEVPAGMVDMRAWVRSLNLWPEG